MGFLDYDRIGVSCCAIEQPLPLHGISWDTSERIAIPGRKRYSFQRSTTQTRRSPETP
jgi:hypothetical protein